jgi:lysozyme family protein
VSPLFLAAFAILIGEEGGYTFDSADPGGETKFGISKRAYPGVDIAALTLADARTIYYRDYFQPMRCDELPHPMPLIAFDAAVNDGKVFATMWLQIAARVAQDGVIGPVTLAAVARDPEAVAIEMTAQRLFFTAKLPTWKNFGLGWSRRLAALPYKAATLACALLLFASVAHAQTPTDIAAAARIRADVTMLNSKTRTPPQRTQAIADLLSVAAMLSATSPHPLPIVNGQCSPLGGVLSVTVPAGLLCSSGTASPVASNGTWTWSCAGSGGGTTAQCSAPCSPTQGTTP